MHFYLFNPPNPSPPSIPNLSAYLYVSLFLSLHAITDLL